MDTWVLVLFAGMAATSVGGIGLILFLIATGNIEI
jgi:hypothetical protein